MWFLPQRICLFRSFFSAHFFFFFSGDYFAFPVSVVGRRFCTRGACKHSDTRFFPIKIHFHFFENLPKNSKRERERERKGFRLPAANRDKVFKEEFLEEDSLKEQGHLKRSYPPAQLLLCARSHWAARSSYCSRTRATLGACSDPRTAYAGHKAMISRKTLHL